MIAIEHDVGLLRVRWVSCIFVQKRPQIPTQKVLVRNLLNSSFSASRSRSGFTFSDMVTLLGTTIDHDVSISAEPLQCTAREGTMVSKTPLVATVVVMGEAVEFPPSERLRDRIKGIVTYTYIGGTLSRFGPSVVRCFRQALSPDTRLQDSYVVNGAIYVGSRHGGSQALSTVRPSGCFKRGWEWRVEEV